MKKINLDNIMCIFLFKCVLPIPRAVLKPKLVVYGSSARQSIWFFGKKGKSGSGLEGRIKNLRGLSLG